MCGRVPRTHGLMTAQGRDASASPNPEQITRQFTASWNNVRRTSGRYPSSMMHVGGIMDMERSGSVGHYKQQEPGSWVTLHVWCPSSRPGGHFSILPYRGLTLHRPQWSVPGCRLVAASAHRPAKSTSTRTHKCEVRSRGSSS